MPSIPLFASSSIAPHRWSTLPAAVVRLAIITATGCAISTMPPAQTASLFGQQAATADDPAKPATASLKPKAEELPPARDLTLQTKVTGNLVNSAPVNLVCTWLAGTHQKDTVPIILVHDWGADRSTLLPLAQHLQRELGCAVLVPDLRGHGESRTLVGSSKRLDAAQFNKNEIPLAAEDLEACKRFLKERHNAGELNLEMLTLVACGKSAALAASWSAADWHWPPSKGLKQGQDVKQLILLSPVRKFETFNLSALVKTPLFSEPKFNGLTTALFWDSRDEESERDAAALETVLVKGLGPAPAADASDRWAQVRYSLKVVPGGGVGSELLSGSKGDLVRNEIAGMIEQKLARRASQYLWLDRSEK
ncbi:MAG: alpha/beta hydrolase [Planctomycetota bacterium]